MTGSRTRLSISQPLIGRLDGTRDLDEHKKLLRVGVLSFVEDDTIILFANSSGQLWQSQQLCCQRDLIGISNCAASKTELAVIALHVCGDAGCTRACPFPQRPKRLPPARGKFSRSRGAWWPRRELIPFPPAAQPVPQLRFCFRDIFRLRAFKGSFDFAEIAFWTVSE